MSGAGGVGMRGRDMPWRGELRGDGTHDKNMTHERERGRDHDRERDGKDDLAVQQQSQYKRQRRSPNQAHNIRSNGPQGVDWNGDHRDAEGSGLPANLVNGTSPVQNSHNYSPNLPFNRVAGQSTTNPSHSGSVDSIKVRVGQNGLIKDYTLALRDLNFLPPNNKLVVALREPRDADGAARLNRNPLVFPYVLQYLATGHKTLSLPPD
ncbi:hypothetical protein SARC_11871, partial [Sphaeroforma arctica JP610]